MRKKWQTETYTFVMFRFWHHNNLFKRTLNLAPKALNWCYTNDKFINTNWVCPKCFHWIRWSQWQNICHYSKRAWTWNPATSCVRDQDATTAQARHMWETGSLNWAQFMLQWFLRFPEFAEFSECLFHLGKTQMSFTIFTQGRTRSDQVYTVS